MKTIFFDLDDTLFDHRQSARAAILAVRQKYGLNALTLDKLEAEYDRLLSQMHPAVMGGRISLEESRRARYSGLFEVCRMPWSEATIEDCLQVGLNAYRNARTAIDGAGGLLCELKRDYRIGIISNNFLAEQKDKLRAIGLADFVDELIVSEEVGFLKPDKRIFDAALSRMRIGPRDCVMIGDSWESDVIGATDAGIPALWFNPLQRQPPDRSLALDLQSFIPSLQARIMIERTLKT